MEEMNSGGQLQPANTPAANRAIAQSNTASGEASPTAIEADSKSGLQPEGDFKHGDRVTFGARHTSYERQPGDPLYRPLRVFVLDPVTPRNECPVAIVNVPYE